MSTTVSHFMSKVILQVI